jgi:hypothetical protein
MCYPRAPTMETASERITQKLWLRTLPFDDAVKTWGGPGSGRECDGCDLAISTEAFEHEFQMKNGRVIHLHVACSNLWQILKEALPSDRKHTPPPSSSL